MVVITRISAQTYRKKHDLNFAVDVHSPRGDEWESLKLSTFIQYPSRGRM